MEGWKRKRRQKVNKLLLQDKLVHGRRTERMERQSLPVLESKAALANSSLGRARVEYRTEPWGHDF